MFFQNRWNLNKTGAFIFIIYACASLFLTWPLILNLNTDLFGDFGDTRGMIWGIWADIHGLRRSETIDLIAAPFGLDNVHLLRQPVFEALLIYPANIFGEVTGYNLLVIMSFPMTAFAAYYFLNYLFQNKLAAFFGGLIFGFCPGAVMQAVGGHLTFTFNIFIPLFFLALFYNRDKRSLQSAFLVGLSYALLTLNSLYIGYFAVFIAFFFIIFDYISLQARNIKQFHLNYLKSAGFATLIIVPSQYRVIIHQLTTTSIALIKTGRIREFENLITFSARPWDYLIPAIDHPVLGRFIMNFSRNNLHGSNLFEQTLYFGFVPLLLCLTGLILYSKINSNPSNRCYFLFFTLGALWMIILSAPSLVSIGTLQIPTVSYFMYKIAPMFRVYARFGILVNFFIACASAVVLSELSQRMSTVRYYLLLSVLLPVLIFEYWSIPPHYARSIDPPPAVYQWLAKEPGDFIVAEYPMMKSDEAAFYTYLFWQRIHKKRMVNGASPDNEKAWDFYHRVNDLSDPETPRLLKDVGVKYIIVHNKMYWEGEIPEALKRYYPPDVSARQYNDGKTPSNVLLPKPFKVFGDDVIYLLDRNSNTT
jgi:hypothetical protein